MKLLIIPLLLCMQAGAQKSYQPTDCVTFIRLSDDTSQWFTVDTIKKEPIKDTVRHWVYDKKGLLGNWQKPAVYCPCGCYEPNIYQQYRVCSITGIRQIRQIVEGYTYIPPRKTDYDKQIDTLRKTIR